MRGAQRRFFEALDALNAQDGASGPGGPRFVEQFRHGSLTVEMYAPRGRDPQQPHDRDEVYVVVEGHGDFVLDGETVAFGPGDLLFVPAGVAHRFEDFSDDLAVWVLFYGPVGGEEPDPTSER